jgi:hypothetical protein
MKPRTRTLELALPRPAAPWCGPWLVAAAAIAVALALLLGA